MEIKGEAVTDRWGVVWTVRRKWMEAPDTWTDSDGIVGTILSVILFLCLLAWPCWFAAKFLGVSSWTILIERGGTEVGTERVRGWRASGRRMDEIRHSILTAGVTQQVPPPHLSARQSRSEHWHR